VITGYVEILILILILIIIIIIIIIITDVAISRDRNVTKKEAEKILKYKELTTEIQRIWNVKTKVIPVIMGGDWDYFKIIQKIREQHTRKT
jgi:uncharacterized membrane protein